MAYINGKEILFSPNINITVGENYVLSDEDIEKIAQVLLENLTIEQEVNESEKPVSSKAVYLYVNDFSQAQETHLQETLTSFETYMDEKHITQDALEKEFQEFSSAYDQIINNAVITQEEFNDYSVLHLEHNKDYHANGDISDLNIHIGSGISSVMFKIVDSGDFNIKIIGCSGYIGKAPDFKNGETWELSIHNGIIASGKVVSE